MVEGDRDFGAPECGIAGADGQPWPCASGGS